MVDSFIVIADGGTLELQYSLVTDIETIPIMPTHIVAHMRVGGAFEPLKVVYWEWVQFWRQFFDGHIAPLGQWSWQQILRYQRNCLYWRSLSVI